MKKSVLRIIMVILCIFCSLISSAYADSPESLLESVLLNENNATYKIFINETINSWVNAFGNRQHAQKLTIKGNGYSVSSDSDNILSGIILNKPDDSSELLKPQSLTISNLKMTYFSTAIANYGGKLSLSVVNFSNNSSVNNGGAINNQSGTLTISGSKYYNSIFHNNTAQNGGAIYNNGDLTIKNTVFGQRSYSSPIHIMDEKGNEYYVDSLTEAISLVYPYHYTIEVIKNPNSADYGGAVYNKNSANISSSTFLLNNANYNGGAVYNSGELSLKSSGFEENSAQNGGAVYINSDKKTILKNSNFYKNTALSNGGAIYINGGDTNITKSYFGSQFKNGNTAVNGGAIYNNGQNTQINSSVFVQNHSTYGGDIYNTGILTISKSTFGAVNSTKYYNIGTLDLWYIDKNKYITYANGITDDNVKPIIIEYKPIIEEEIYGSYAYRGGAIFNSGEIHINSSKFTYAHAFEGGAIFNDSDGYLEIKKSTFTKNYAKTKGVLYLIAVVMF